MQCILLRSRPSLRWTLSVHNKYFLCTPVYLSFHTLHEMMSLLMSTCCTLAIVSVSLQALETNESLRHLGLAHNNMGPDDACLVAEASAF